MCAPGIHSRMRTGTLKCGSAVGSGSMLSRDFKVRPKEVPRCGPYILYF